jgi:predicted ATPase with chaperone activity
VQYVKDASATTQDNVRPAPLRPPPVRAAAGRIDLYVQAERLTAEELTDAADAEPTAPVRARVLASADVAGHCQVVPAARRTLMSAVDRLGLSARGFHRALRVARTVADLADSDRVEDEHVREALTLRHLPIIGDRETQLI